VQSEEAIAARGPAFFACLTITLLLIIEPI